MNDIGSCVSIDMKMSIRNIRSDSRMAGRDVIVGVGMERAKVDDSDSSRPIDDDVFRTEIAVMQAFGGDRTQAFTSLGHHFRDHAIVQASEPCQFEEIDTVDPFENESAAFREVLPTQDADTV